MVSKAPFLINYPLERNIGDAVIPAQAGIQQRCAHAAKDLVAADAAWTGFQPARE